MSVNILEVSIAQLLSAETECQRLTQYVRGLRYESRLRLDFKAPVTFGTQRTNPMATP